MLDLVISSLWLTCSCPFISLSFANCWNAESLWLGVSCQPDRQRWILPNEVWRDLAPCPWTSLFLTFLLCQEGSELCQHSQTYQRPGRLRWNLLLPEPLSLRQHFYSQSTESEGKKKKKSWDYSSEVIIWLERQARAQIKRTPGVLDVSLDPGWVNPSPKSLLA